MKKTYILEELDCPNCAMKVERNVEKIKGVQEVNVNFAQKKMYVEFEDASLVDEIKKCVMDTEPDVHIVDANEIKQHEHSHEEATCSCGHDHTHSHEHEHCECDHEEKNERVLNNAVKIHVRGLDCASCAQKIEDAIANVNGVQDASLNFSSSILFVKSNMDDTRLLEVLQKVTDKVEPGVQLSINKQKENTKTSLFKSEGLRLIMSVTIFIIAIILQEESYAFYLFALSYIVSGGKVVLTAIRNILKGEIFDENFLMSIATIGAFAIGDYKEGVAVMIFYEIGELFQSYAVNRSRKSISSLMNIRADFAMKIVDGKEVKVTPEEVHVNDIIQIRAGERVPLDGILVSGESSLDTSALTGESLPRDVQVNDEVLAGSVNISGLIQLRVNKEFSESTVSRILELVENAGSKKAPMEKFITKFARIYTPVVVILALMLLIIPMMFIEDAVFYDMLYRSLTFLIVSCPCALVVSIPLGMFAGIGGASKQGILIKGGNYLEALSDVETVVFDKTGTLTKGSFHVEKIVPTNGDEQELLQIGAYGESYSNHPIAISIVKAYGEAIQQERLDEFSEIAGNGIQVRIDGKLTYLGNTKLMDAHQIKYSEASEIGTVVHIAQETYLGYIVISDEIKETSAAAIQALKAQGIKKCIMLSGDRDEVAQAVGNKLHLDKVYSQLLPGDKVTKIEEILADKANGKVAFVGDGMNDAPVLARADIGVAMGGIGSDAAIEASDIVLMKDDPKALAVAMHISKRTKRILWQNIVFSLVVKIGILILTVFGYSTMWMGVFADVGVTLLAVINSMRALKVDENI